MIQRDFWCTYLFGAHAYHARYTYLNLTIKLGASMHPFVLSLLALRRC
jgi:hypothetical protein